MSIYAYKARDPQGEILAGELDAADENAVAGELDKLGYSVISIQPQSLPLFSLNEIRNRFRPIDRAQLILFTRQLASLVHSGMPLLPSLETITEQTTHPKFKVILEDIRQTVQGGASFSEALAKYPKVFPELFVSMVEVGETGGILDRVLGRLAKLTMQEMETQSRVQSALIYPMVLVVVAFLVVNFILVGVIPRFALIFESAGTSLPIPTRILLALSWIVQNLWIPILAALIGGIFWFQKRLKTEEGKFQFDGWLLKAPVFGALYNKIQISRFTRTLSTLTSSGIAMLPALVVVEKTVTNTVIRRSVRTIRASLTEGKPVVESFKMSGFFSPMAIQMVSSGERSGHLDSALDEIADFYEPEIELTIKNMTSLLEPFMLLGMGLVVGFVAMAVLLPIFNMMKVFRS